MSERDQGRFAQRVFDTWKGRSAPAGWHAAVEAELFAGDARRALKALVAGEDQAEDPVVRAWIEVQRVGFLRRRRFRILERNERGQRSEDEGEELEHDG